MLKRGFFILLLLWPLIGYSAPLTESEQQAKQQGIALFNGGHEAKALLEPAAKAGDAEAQYYLGESLRQDNFATVTKEAYYWYEQAAQQNELYAMIQLGRSVDYCELFQSCTLTPKQWKAKAKQLAQERIQQGDSEAMGLMYNLTGDKSWIEKAAQAGNPYYQNKLAQDYLYDDKKFANEAEQTAAYNALIEKAAKGGYVPAMYNYGGSLVQQGKLKEGQEWVLKAVNAGDLMSTKIYAVAIVDEEFNKTDIFKFPIDRIKGYGLLTVIAENGGADGSSAQRRLKETEKHMTPEQIKQGKTFAQEWKKTHPPLSYFYPKLGLI